METVCCARVILRFDQRTVDYDKIVELKEVRYTRRALIKERVLEWACLSSR
jgi:hypothetical protein